MVRRSRYFPSDDPSQMVCAEGTGHCPKGLSGSRDQATPRAALARSMAAHKSSFAALSNAAALSNISSGFSRFASLRSQISVSKRSEEHTSELQSLMRISYAVFCLKKKNHTKHNS